MRAPMWLMASAASPESQVKCMSTSTRTLQLSESPSESLCRRAVNADAGKEFRTRWRISLTATLWLMSKSLPMTMT